MLADTLRKISAGGGVSEKIGPKTIGGSSNASATAFSSQRRVDRCQNGVLWAMYWDGGSSTSSSWDFYYSTDNGTTWVLGGTFGFFGTAQNYFPNGSFFIDKEDYAHVTYKDRDNGYIYYRRGTPNAGRTSYTWSAALGVYKSYHMNYPDIVAHKQGTGWKAHIVASYI